jgi:anti-anti-sigma factor
MELRDRPSIAVESSADGCREIKLFGEINVSLSADLHGECLEIARGGKDAVVDCEGVGSFDAAALQILASLKDALASQGRNLRIAKLSQELIGTIRLAGMTQHLGELIAP